MPGIDLHAHLAPLLGEPSADVAGGGAAPSGGELRAGPDPRDDGLPAGVTATADGRLAVDGHAVGPAGLYDPDRLVDHLASLGLDAAAVSVPPPFFRQQLGAEQAAAWARAANDGLLATIGDRPQLLPLAYLPLEHPPLALAEYERVRGQGRWAGVCGSAGGRSVSLADDALAPLWSALDRDARLLLLHPGSSPDPRLERFYLGNLLGNPVESALAAAELVFGDVLATHPRMRVLLVHCGGCTAGLVGRWERGVETSRPGLRPLAEPPRVAVRRLSVDCLAHDPAVVSLALETFGEERLVLGSDWPFPMGIDDPRELVAHLPADLRARIAVDNAHRLLGITGDRAEPAEA